MSILSLTNINKFYGSFHAAKDVSFHVREGTTLSLLGPSGCGKTTTLRMIAGLEEVTSGTIHLSGVDITYDPPFKRNTSMVFQNYALFPHMTVSENIGFGLKMRKVDKDKIPGKVTRALEMIHLEGHEDRMPNELSGGQQQRVSLARALAVEPSLLLLDEPLSNLDARLREEMRIEIKRIQNDTGITSVFVTHDQEEALTLSDFILVMNNGRVVETGTPQDVYSNPGCLFTASFIGNSNLVQGDIVEIEETTTVVKASEDLIFRCNSDPRFVKDERVTVLLKQECLNVTAGSFAPHPSMNRATGTLRLVTFLGPSIEYICTIGNQEMRIRRPNEGELPDLKLNQEINIEWNFSDGKLLKC
jgi:ABC-type Fe3+/spermidine/putrescine transport system ATPase subunit